MSAPENEKLPREGSVASHFIEFSGVTWPKSALRMAALAAMLRVPESAHEPYVVEDSSVENKWRLVIGPYPVFLAVRDEFRVQACPSPNRRRSGRGSSASSSTAATTPGSGKTSSAMY